MSDKNGDVKVLQASASQLQRDESLEFDPLLEAHQALRRESNFSKNSSQKQKVDLTFKDLEYEVDIGKGKDATVKHILKGIDGEAKSGQVLAIMGASGAGKTTLLNLLAGRLSQAGSGRTSGTILVNGQKRDFSTFRHASAYVLQDDVFFAGLTVLETITLSASLRLPQSVSKEEKLQRVDAIINELGLTKVKDTLVGDEIIRGVSGGERKRVNIGTELVTEPSLIFLDEPTTGLDSFNAQNVMSTLLQLARNGRTIVTTIHQPRSSIYSMFDQLMLLSDGYCLYFGEASQATNYFSGLGYECPDSFNPADYFLDLVSTDTRSTERERITQKRIKYLVDSYNEHRKNEPIEYSRATGGIQQVFGDEESGSRSGKYATSFFHQFGVLTQRSFKSVLRERANNIARISQTIVFALLIGLIWLQEGGDDSGSAIQSVAGGLFFMLVNQSFGGIFTIIFLFPTERVIVLKERASRSYHVGAYFWSKSVADIPLTFFLTVLFACIAYWMAGLRPEAEYFFLYILVIFLLSLAAEGIAYCVSALAKDPQQAGAIAPIFVVTSMLFGGFFISVESIPVWLSWLRYLSFLKYGFAAAMQVEFEDRTFDTSACINDDNTTAPFCPSTGSEVLAFYEVDELSLASNLCILLGMAACLRLLAYLILRFNGPVYDTSI